MGSRCHLARLHPTVSISSLSSHVMLDRRSRHQRHIRRSKDCIGLSSRVARKTCQLSKALAWVLLSRKVPSSSGSPSLKNLIGAIDKINSKIQLFRTMFSSRILCIANLRGSPSFMPSSSVVEPSHPNHVPE